MPRMRIKSTLPQRDLPLPKRVGGPSREDSWLEEKEDQIKAKSDDVLVYLLVDLDGARDIAQGIVPRYVIRQAKSALLWNLETAGR